MGVKVRVVLEVNISSLFLLFIIAKKELQKGIIF